ncbi:MAG TPA: hypothetical protein VIW73_09335 [Candidatus Cybelea sp.]
MKESLRAIACAAVLSAPLAGSLARPVLADAPVCSILTQAQVSSIVGGPVDSGVSITRTNPSAPGAVGHACAYVGQTHSAVLGIYKGSGSQLHQIQTINERSGSVTAMHGGLLVSAFVSSGAKGSATPDKTAAKALLNAALAKM